MQFADPRGQPSSLLSGLELSSAEIPLSGGSVLPVEPPSLARLDPFSAAPGSASSAAAPIRSSAAAALLRGFTVRAARISLLRVPEPGGLPLGVVARAVPARKLRTA